MKLRSREIERKIIKLVEWREFARVGKKERREAVRFERHTRNRQLWTSRQMTNGSLLPSSLSTVVSAFVR